MSQHTIILPSKTESGKAAVVIGYHEIAGEPAYFCSINDMGEKPHQLFNSMFAPGYQKVCEPIGFATVLGEHGIVLPDFIIRALEEDRVKRIQSNVMYSWQATGEFEQLN